MTLKQNRVQERKKEKENRRKVQGVKEPEGEGGCQGVSLAGSQINILYKIIYNLKCFSERMKSQ